MFDLENTATPAPVVFGGVSNGSTFKNVGIGTFHPGQMLDVNGTVRDLGEVLLSNVPAVTSNELYNSSGTLYFNGTALALATTQWLTNTGVGIGTYNNVGIGTTTPQGAFVVTNGNVGIGTWSPLATLQVTGTLNNASFVVASNGNVGIGTWVPADVLTVNTSNAAITLGNVTGSTVRTGGGSGLVLQSPAGGTLYFNRDNTNVTTKFESGSTTDLMSILPTGNVGIGTTTPQGAFVVTNGNVGIGTWTPNALLDVQGTLQHFYVTQNGNVGIGTVNPLSKLHLYNIYRHDDASVSS